MVLLNTVAVNLKDSPPFASMINSHLSLADRVRFGQLNTNGLREAAQKEWAKATEHFEQAGQLDARSAELQFHWGEALLTQTNLAGAREHLQLACDNDALPFRADSRINAAIRAEREKIGGKGLILFDAATALAAGSGTGVCGQETFFEHVHFDFDGRYRLGRGWAEQIEPLLPRNTNAWVSQAACEHMLGLSAWNRAQVIYFMDERMQMPPLSSQANNVRRRGALEARISQLGTQMKADNVARTRQGFLKLLQQQPQDYFLHQENAVFLELTGDLAGAATEWQRYCDLLPQDSLGYYQAGRLLNAQQKYAEAEAALRIAVTIRPSRTDGWLELGNALALQNKYPEALACYSTALKQNSQSAPSLLGRGRVLARLNRHAEAMENYRAAIQLNPADGLPHHELGLELVAARESDAAGTEFCEAARLSPDIVVARFDYGTWLMSHNHWDEAQREFVAAVRLNPAFPTSHLNLGLALFKLGSLDEAERQFEETLRLEPGNSKASDYLLQVRALKRDQKR
jgi:tetratricopeptide (TPR) repeat protein